MILVAGGTGVLGTQVVRSLSARGLPVRVLTRDSTRARHLSGDHVEIVEGDVRDPSVVEKAMAEARTVISAIHGFVGTGASNPRTVDMQGNAALIEAARRMGAERFVLLSIHGAAADHPIELFRMKYAAEQALQASGLTWTIIRPTAYMETWIKLIGEPLVNTGKTRVFGNGSNPINFVSAHDVAQYVTCAATETTMRGERVAVGGPENLSMRQLAETIMRVTHIRGAISAVPLPMMRLMAVAMRPVNPALARQIQAGVVMDTTDMSFDPTEMRRRYPSMSCTPLEDVIRRDLSARI